MILNTETTRQNLQMQNFEKYNLQMQNFEKYSSPALQGHETKLVGFLRQKWLAEK